MSQEVLSRCSQLSFSLAHFKTEARGSSELPKVAQQQGGRAVRGLFLSQGVVRWLFLSGDESHQGP